MQAFEFYSPTKIIFGSGTQDQVGKLAADYGGKRVFVVYGGRSAVNSGLLDQVTAALTHSGLEFDLLGGVQPNPRLSFAREGVEKAIAFGADFVLAVGGGSVIDTAKAICHGVANPGVDIWDFWQGQAPLTTSLPLGVVLTIPAAGSESSNSAVLTNDDTLQKRGLSTDLNRPRFAILNPELTYSLPRFQLTCGIVDIMMHTMDRYFNPVFTNELTDELAEALLRTTIRNGRRAVEYPNDYQAMSELMWAGSVSHNGLTGLGSQKDFAPHQLGHELSAKFDSVHGATLSAIWDSWARHVVDAHPARFARFGRNVWGLSGEGMTEMELAIAAIDATANFFRSIGMPTTLGELPGCGVQSEEVLEDLAFRCTYRGKRTIGAFKVLGHDEIKSVYRMANR